MFGTFAADSATVTPLLIALIGSSGFIGAVVALVKLRPEMSTSAVAQAQGALEMMQQLVEDLEKDRDYWQKRYIDSHKRCTELEDQAVQYRSMIRGLGGHIT